MKKTKPKIIVILGQTATGKSDLAVKIAKEISGEIISADSRQVYRSLNIGTGKITKKEMRGIPHYLLDVASPKKQFSVAEYKKLAEDKIEDIFKRGKIPIIVGGTGFYIQAIVDDINLPDVPPNSKLRKKLEKMKTEKLFALLRKLNPKRAETIDRHNPRRLIRAIEVAVTLSNSGKMLLRKDLEGATGAGQRKFSAENFRAFRDNILPEFLQIGIKLPDEILKEKIYKRLISRINPPAGGGMINEAKRLHRRGLSWKRMHELGLEYRYLALYLQNKISKEEMVKQLDTAIWHYAKRQWTWFKRDKRIIWLNPTQKSDLKKLERLIKKFLK